MSASETATVTLLFLGQSSANWESKLVQREGDLLFLSFEEGGASRETRPGRRRISINGQLHPDTGTLFSRVCICVMLLPLVGSQGSLSPSCLEDCISD